MRVLTGLDGFELGSNWFDGFQGFRGPGTLRVVWGCWGVFGPFKPWFLAHLISTYISLTGIRFAVMKKHKETKTIEKHLP